MHHLGLFFSYIFYYSTLLTNTQLWYFFKILILVFKTFLLPVIELRFYSIAFSPSITRYAQNSDWYIFIIFFSVVDCWWRLLFKFRKHTHTQLKKNVTVAHENRELNKQKITRQIAAEKLNRKMKIKLLNDRMGRRSATTSRRVECENSYRLRTDIRGWRCECCVHCLSAAPMLLLLSLIAAAVAVRYRATAAATLVRLFSVRVCEACECDGHVC